MAKCTECGLEMSGDSPADTCSANDRVHLGGFDWIPTKRWIPQNDDPTERCPDCNVAPNGHHHPGCALERCPSCGGQRISCGCNI